MLSVLLATAENISFKLFFWGGEVVGGGGRGSEQQIFPRGEHPSPQLISVQASTQKGTLDELLRQSPCVVQASGFVRSFSQQHILVLYRLGQGAIWALVSSAPSAK